MNKPTTATRTDRMREQIAAAKRVQGEVEYRCIACDRIMLRFTPPIHLITMPCRRCGEWNVLTTTTRV